MTQGQAESGPEVTSAPIPKESFRSVYLEMWYSPAGAETTEDTAKDATSMANGTGFFFKVESVSYIVTARHNLSGKHWETNEFLSDRSVEPTHLKVGFRQPPEGNLYKTETLRIDEYLLPLIDRDGAPLWLEHPEYRGRMDVAAVPFDLPWKDDIEYWVPESSGSGVDSGVWVAKDTFIVGYPFGLRVGLDLPLWVRGTIASEPALLYPHNDEPLPLILVDARTRKGQSGSPVLVLNRQFADDTPPARSTPRSKLIGVYSGRTNDESDLGFVWRIEEVMKILGGNTRGRFQ